MIDILRQLSSSTRPAKTARCSSLLQEAMALHQRGSLREAEKLYQSILRADRDHGEALHYLGILRAQERKFAEAAKLIRRALVQNPNSAEAHNNLATVLDALGEREKAIAHFEMAIAAKPGYAEAHNNLGSSLAALGRRDEAVAHFEKALASEPRYAGAHNNLGSVLFGLGRHEEAIEHCRQALALQPDYADAYNNLGNALAALNRFQEALTSFERALALNPNHAEAYSNLGATLVMLDRPEEAIAQYEKALAVKPNYAAAHLNLASAYLILHRPQEAERHAEKALDLRPDYPEAHNTLGLAFKLLDRHDAAMAQFNRALAVKPDYAEAYNNIGAELKELGRLDDARMMITKAIEIAPKRAGFYRNLADCQRFAAQDPHFKMMVELAREAVALRPQEQMELYFALGKAYADLEQYERSLSHLLAANALKRQHVVYDEATVLGTFERTARIFTRELMQAKAGAGNPSPIPVFIVGMPRSGTTLIEQVLASHPKVFGGGELKFFSQALTRIITESGTPAPFPEVVAAMTDVQFERLGAYYLEAAAAAAPATARMTDKMPSNFQYLGFIHLALPNARIINTRRNPLDTCLSCFSTLFAEGQEHTYDLGELGRYYRAYDLLMKHWRSVLPATAMIEVEYEALVGDFETQARRIVAHCGLDWDDSCLAFDKTQRPVRTASSTQVRRPIYRSSIGRWRPYRDLLRPLLDALGRDLAGEPSET